mmetsp:Transcript_4958/g.11666  ORF Transcript_4958/g.11666 Transcript_4958/m.11666 type:complete len:146 (+) Transcript_4958:1977-2414(+)
MGSLSALAAAAPNLTHLDLSRTLVVDLRPLSACRKLRRLMLKWTTGVQDLNPLSGCALIEELDLRHTGVSDIGPLLGLPKLARLNLCSTKLADAAAARAALEKACPDLGYINTHNCPAAAEPTPEPAAEFALAQPPIAAFAGLSC